MEDEDSRHGSDIDGAPIEDLDGLPLDSKEVEIKTIDGKPLVEDVDGDSYTEELDGAPCKWDKYTKLSTYTANCASLCK